MYFGKVVPGSNAYWRAKKAELYSWINHHIEKGRGPPNVFMTLSCAEYFWPDLKRLLETHIQLTEGAQVNLDLNINKLQKALNDYTIVVQEFFQIRVEKFLKSIGFELLGSITGVDLNLLNREDKFIYIYLVSPMMQVL